MPISDLKQLARLRRVGRLLEGKKELQLQPSGVRFSLVDCVVLLRAQLEDPEDHECPVNVLEEISALMKQARDLIDQHGSQLAAAHAAFGGQVRSEMNGLIATLDDNRARAVPGALYLPASDRAALLSELNSRFPKE